MAHTYVSFHSRSLSFILEEFFFFFLVHLSYEDIQFGVEKDGTFEAKELPFSKPLTVGVLRAH